MQGDDENGRDWRRWVPTAVQESGGRASMFSALRVRKSRRWSACPDRMPVGTAKTEGACVAYARRPLRIGGPDGRIGRKFLHAGPGYGGSRYRNRAALAEAATSSRLRGMMSARVGEKHSECFLEWNHGCPPDRCLQPLGASGGEGYVRWA